MCSGAQCPRSSAGRIVDGQTEYVASFPGVHFREWGRVTQAMKDKSVACVFVPGGSPMYGDHDEDPDHPGKCFCQTFLPVLWVAIQFEGHRDACKPGPRVIRVWRAL